MLSRRRAIKAKQALPRMPYQFEFDFMGLKAVQGLRVKNSVRIYSLGNRFVGEFKRKNHLKMNKRFNFRVSFFEIDVKRMKKVPKKMIATGQIIEVSNNFPSDWKRFPGFKGLQELIESRRAAEIFVGLEKNYQSLEWQRKGFGEKISQTLIEEARKQGIQVIIAIVRQNNFKVRAGLKKQGFKQFRKSVFWVKEI